MLGAHVATALVEDAVTARGLGTSLELVKRRRPVTWRFVLVVACLSLAHGETTRHDCRILSDEHLLLVEGLPVRTLSVRDTRSFARRHVLRVHVQSGRHLVFFDHLLHVSLLIQLPMLRVTIQAVQIVSLDASYLIFPFSLYDLHQRLLVVLTLDKVPSSLSYQGATLRPLA